MGMDYVPFNRVVAFEGSKMTNSLPGEILRGLSSSPKD